MKLNIKITSIIFALATLMTGCEAYVDQSAPKITKKIIAKEAPVEQRMGCDFFADEPLRQKSVTIHYLIAEDGSVVEVGVSEYAIAQVGSNYTASAWRQK